MPNIPADLRHNLHQSGHGHVLNWWEHLSEEEQTELHNQLASLDLPHLKTLYEGRHKASFVPPAEQIKPIPVIRVASTRRKPASSARRRCGPAAWRACSSRAARGVGSASSTPRECFPSAP